ncbi:MAG: hypothetical protein K6G33_10770 [Ruminococcus sp.]|uniref:hypothetical protein n=1 Tax=Ruminococcus sp. TaxID=41978 RepID=UPI0025F40F25|nr:hypothetical protein [Ruminococcus sp.]MCR5601207.1 hypothetical protein [Ruminococcus sp.]
MNRKEFSQTKTIVSPDGNTIITLTVNGSTESSESTSTVKTSNTSTSTTVTSTSTTTVTSIKKEE